MIPTAMQSFRVGTMVLHFEVTLEPPLKFEGTHARTHTPAYAHAHARASGGVWERAAYPKHDDTGPAAPFTWPALCTQANLISVDNVRAYYQHGTHGRTSIY